MPNVLQPARPALNVEFVAAPMLDLVNAIYFTFLVGELDGIDGWPADTRAALDPALRTDMETLFNYPRTEPGIFGALIDLLFHHRETWNSVEALLDFVRGLPAGGASLPGDPGIQALALYALRWTRDEDAVSDRGTRTRATLVDLLAHDRRDPAAALRLFDHPEDVRALLCRTIRRFYDEHYRADERRRVDTMRASVAAHASDDASDPDALLRRITGRPVVCLDEEPSAYTDMIFVPSTDVGPYHSCADIPPVHGLYYPAEVPAGATPGDDARIRELALVYRALSDEQRLRIMRLLRGGELYAQEIVERTGLNQSVVSRHLTFLKAVGLVNARRQNNMKFFSLNGQMRDGLRAAVDLLLPANA